ncbi:hypothetical protein [Ignavibacterium sp.]|jgi:hypothetical protein|uniref:hypothetical protein n=1 Tax=Ignavibacterium sp. TaxID=2651167 RepID=UPI0025C4DD3C|nr:hypothetical protein [Ignavibacterium sp.]
MVKINLQILLIASISSFAFLFNSDNSKSCGWDYDENFLRSGLFNPDILKDDSLSAFFLSPRFFSEYSEESLLNPEVENIREWKNYFNNEYSSKELKNLIYESSPNDIRILADAKLNNNPSIVPKKLAKSNIAKDFISGKYPDAFDYLIFAKECEPHVIDNRKSEWDELMRDTLAMKDLLEKGKLYLQRTTDKFLAERYAYQVVRLAHYMKNYDLTINLFDELFEKLKSKSIIYYWALSHKAGALRSKGDLSYSSYLFSVIFDKCLSRRLIASQNFKSLDASTLHETLNYCNDNHEKTAVWFLHAYLTNDFGSMKQIYELEPNSAYLEILLSRAIDRLENDIYEYWNIDENTGWSNQFIRLDYPNFYSFVSSCAKKENTLRPYFWYYAAGYLSLLRHDYVSMKENFSAVKRLLPKDDSEYNIRIKILEILARVDEQKNIDKIFETNILEELKWVRDLKKYNSDDAFIWMMKRFSEKYYKQQDTVKAILSLGLKLNNSEYPRTVSYIDFRSNPGRAPLDKIINFIEYNPNKSDFEKYLVENFIYTTKDLYEIRGTLLLSKYDFENALLWNFSNIKNNLPMLPADPFKMNINDCHDCDAESLKTKIYTKYTFAKRMLELEKEIKTTSKNRAENYYLLANAYYNMTYFGNSWMVVDFYRSLNSTDDDPNYLDCSKAEEYYLKAMASSKDKNFQARCLFMAAKCEQNRFYVDKGYFQIKNFNLYYPDDCEPNPQIKKENYRMYFKTLKDNYSKTEFYKQALKECKYFNYFVTNYK